ncbi:hypothetical protein FIBSPDRAFT_909652 [Athelia psychrophila]|uniref:Uncharacterized protein n=1 Tax=Athelia psychrophila TaxID=1759441 RepID=A0A166NPW7_9AGAM|nr:hypothetical protein FIBSPDRAFT_909652 [Fibularhizoctonia sp. CBS 109695]
MLLPPKLGEIGTCYGSPLARHNSAQFIISLGYFNLLSILGIEENVFLNWKTTLAKLFTYRNGMAIEYPATHAERPIGHLFKLNPDNWINPCTSFAYSQGEPKGRSRATERGKQIFCPLLVDANGDKVPCRVSHSTCQGCKVCPYADCEALRNPHEAATREALQVPAQRVLFAKTLTLYRSYCAHGCLGPSSPSEFLAASLDDTESAWLARLQEMRRGHNCKVTCDGRLIFDHDTAGQAFTEYLEALFDNDLEVIAKFETAALANGYGPLATCTYVANHVSNRVTCPYEHRTVDGSLDLAKLVSLPCDTSFQCFEPLEEYRAACPQMLVVCRNAHSHPIPLPIKTPPAIRREVFDLLSTIEQDLADITPRRFLRHPVTRAYLNDRLPTIQNPCLADLHISLANRDHIKTYISQVQRNCFPFGTGWKDMAQYIRYTAETPLNGLPVYDEDDPDHSDPSDTAMMLRIIICMSPESSRRLAAAQYLQSDIAFKRVSGFLEFKIGGLDRNANMAVPYCRVFLNRQSAAAHTLVFKEIERIVLMDTGMSLKWRHLHASSLDDHTGILQWAGDQHAGQAKGLGLHLQSLAEKLPGKFDLHEPCRPLASLTEYEHLLQIFRLCQVHVERNIDASSVPETVKRKMRSLICMTHPDFEGTLRTIANEGGKKGADWVQDKIRCKFALPGICWEKSFIPKIIWQVADSTTNTLETLHADVNLEGKFCSLCSLLGGVKKVLARQKNLACKDDRITTANKRLKSTHDGVLEANKQLLAARNQPQGQVHEERYCQQVARAEKRKVAAEATYTKALASSTGAKGTGTGRVALLLPSDVADGMHRRS